MRDAFGGLLNIVIIVVFLVIVSGYLAFNVNYTKAFRVKNKIISAFEQHEGACGSEASSGNSCNETIEKYMKSVGYNAPKINLAGEGYNCEQKGYCYKRVCLNDAEDGYKKMYVKVVTQININLPIINNILNLKIFQVAGDSTVIKVPKSSSLKCVKES